MGDAYVHKHGHTHGHAHGHTRWVMPAPTIRCVKRNFCSKFTSLLPSTGSEQVTRQVVSKLLSQIFTSDWVQPDVSLANGKQLHQPVHGGVPLTCQIIAIINPVKSTQSCQACHPPTTHFPLKVPTAVDTHQPSATHHRASLSSGIALANQHTFLSCGYDDRSSRAITI